MAKEVAAGVSPRSDPCEGKGGKKEEKKGGKSVRIHGCLAFEAGSTRAKVLITFPPVLEAFDEIGREIDEKGGRGEKKK